MKPVLGIVGAAVVLIGDGFLGIQANAQAERSEAPLTKAPMENRGIAGYEGWWNSTPVKVKEEFLVDERGAPIIFDEKGKPIRQP